MEVIGLSGFAGAGKSTVAQYLVHQHGFTRLSFAAAVKDITAIAFNWERDRLEGSTPQDRAWRDQPDVFWSERLGRPITPRSALQFIGTDIFRYHVSPSIWADILVARIRHLPLTAKVVIDDVRFVNERRALREVGARFLLLRRAEFPSPVHERLWTTARNGLPILGSQIASPWEPDALHQSEWDWLQDATVADDSVITNCGSYDELYTAIDQWYTAPRASELTYA